MAGHVIIAVTNIYLVNLTRPELSSAADVLCLGVQKGCLTVFFEE